MKMKLNISIYVLFGVLVFLLIIRHLYTTVLLLFNELLGSSKYIKAYELQDVSLLDISAIIIKSLCLFILIYGIVLLTRVLNQFNKNQFFNFKIRHLLNTIGKLFLTSGLLQFLFGYATIFYTNFNYQVYTAPMRSEFVIFTAILGAFFILFSRVISTGTLLKQENELTI